MNYSNSSQFSFASSQGEFSPDLQKAAVWPSKRRGGLKGDMEEGETKIQTPSFQRQKVSPKPSPEEELGNPKHAGFNLSQTIEVRDCPNLSMVSQDSQFLDVAPHYFVSKHEMSSIMFPQNQHYIQQDLSQISFEDRCSPHLVQLRPEHLEMGDFSFHPTQEKLSSSSSGIPL